MMNANPTFVANLITYYEKIVLRGEQTIEQAADNLHTELYGRDPVLAEQVVMAFEHDMANPSADRTLASFGKRVLYWMGWGVEKAEDINGVHNYLFDKGSLRTEPARVGSQRRSDIGGDVPQSEDELLGYDDNCYEAAQGLADDYPGLSPVSGTYQGSPHAWTVDGQGTIYDPAHWTVDDSGEVGLIAGADHPKHRHYLPLKGSLRTTIAAGPSGEINPAWEAMRQYTGWGWQPRNPDHPSQDHFAGEGPNGRIEMGLMPRGDGYYMQGFGAYPEGQGMGTQTMNALRQHLDASGNSLTLHSTNPFFDKFDWLQKTPVTADMSEYQYAPKGSLRTSHRLWWQPGDWGRGLYNHATGELLTWPEEEAEHEERLAVQHGPGWDDMASVEQPPTHINIDPQGRWTISSFDGPVADMDNAYDYLHQQFTAADPRLCHVNERKGSLAGFPSRAGSIGYNQAMAADPAFIEQWIQKHGPYVYHGARIPETGVEGRSDLNTVDDVIRAIQQEGIHPDKRMQEEYPGHPGIEPCPGCGTVGAVGDDGKCNVCGQAGLDYDAERDGDMDEWWHSPRPGHVFMTTNPWTAYGPHVFRVDLRKLDPANINPDDDYLRDHRPGDLNFGKWTMPTADNPPKSLGQQAEDMNFGENPEDTHNSFDQYGVIGHRGPVPPEAVEYMQPDYWSNAVNNNGYGHPEMWEGWQPHQSANRVASVDDDDYLRRVRDEIRQGEDCEYGQCHFVAESLNHQFPEARHDSGFYSLPDERLAPYGYKGYIGDHSWNTLPDGTILDTTADQFGGDQDIERIPPTDPRYQNYISYNTHHEPNCIFHDWYSPHERCEHPDCYKQNCADCEKRKQVPRELQRPSQWDESHTKTDTSGWGRDDEHLAGSRPIKLSGYVSKCCEARVTLGDTHCQSCDSELALKRRHALHLKDLPPEDRALVECFKNFLDQRNPLFPWLIKRYKTGELTMNTYFKQGYFDPYVKALSRPEEWGRDEIRDMRDRMIGYGPEDEFTIAGDWPDEERDIGSALPTIRHWYSTARRYDPNFNLNSYNLPGVSNHYKRILAEKAKHYGKVVHTLPNGWTVRKVQTKEEAEHEGSMMANCIGSDYGQRIEEGENHIYSLRDEKNKPKVSIEVEDPGTRPAFEQIYAKANEEPKDVYKAMVKHWVENDPHTFPVRPTSVDSATATHHRELGQEIHDPYGAVQRPSPSWPSVFKSLYQPEGEDGPRVYDPEAIQRTVQYATTKGDYYGLLQAAQRRAQEYAFTVNLLRDEGNQAALEAMQQSPGLRTTSDVEQALASKDVYNGGPYLKLARREAVPHTNEFNEPCMCPWGGYKPTANNDPVISSQLISTTPGMVDPWQCQCGGRMSEPKPMGTGYSTQCDRCTRTKILPLYHPAVKPQPTPPRVPMTARVAGIWWNQGHGRALVTPEGEAHTWPEGEATHADRSNALGYLVDQCHSFVIRPDGTTKLVIPARGTSRGEQARACRVLADADPRLKLDDWRVAKAAEGLSVLYSLAAQGALPTLVEGPQHRHGDDQGDESGAVWVTTEDTEADTERATHEPNHRDPEGGWSSTEMLHSAVLLKGDYPARIAQSDTGTDDEAHHDGQGTLVGRGDGNPSNHPHRKDSEPHPRREAEGHLAERVQPVAGVGHHQADDARLDTGRGMVDAAARAVLLARLAAEGDRTASGEAVEELGRVVPASAIDGTILGPIENGRHATRIADTQGEGRAVAEQEAYDAPESAPQPREASWQWDWGTGSG